MECPVITRYRQDEIRKYFITNLCLRWCCETPFNLKLVIIKSMEIPLVIMLRLP